MLTLLFSGLYDRMCFQIVGPQRNILRIQMDAVKGIISGQIAIFITDCTVDVQIKDILSVCKSLQLFIALTYRVADIRRGALARAFQSDHATGFL